MTTTTVSPSSIHAHEDKAHEDKAHGETVTGVSAGYGENGYAQQNGHALPASPVQAARAALPTFPLEVGWRTVYDPATQSYTQQPLTLLDILFPTEDNVDVVFMAQSPLHNLWLRWLSTMLETYLVLQKLITNDVLIHWGLPGAPPKSPDLAVMPAGHVPAEGQKSYRVGRDGPPPSFIIEITSKETRAIDLHVKPIFYAAVGVKEFLVIDLLTRRKHPWRLLGYRLADSPYYQSVTPEADGSLAFPTIGLRFRVVGRERIEVYSLATGERLLTPQELKEHADAETARADQEAAARQATEVELAATRKRLRELEARYHLQSEK